MRTTAFQTIPSPLVRQIQAAVEDGVSEDEL
jgi:hypothetical protein